MKQLDKKMQANPRRDQFNSTALKLGLKGARFDGTVQKKIEVGWID